MSNAVTVSADKLAELQRDAARYRWLRDRLAIEDVERLDREYLGSHEESESKRCDEAVDAAMHADGVSLDGWKIRDWCTDPDNCKRCSAQDQADHKHAGIPVGPQRNAGVKGREHG